MKTKSQYRQVVEFGIHQFNLLGSLVMGPRLHRGSGAVKNNDGDDFGILQFDNFPSESLDVSSKRKQRDVSVHNVNFFNVPLPKRFSNNLLYSRYSKSQGLATRVGCLEHQITCVDSYPFTGIL